MQQQIKKLPAVVLTGGLVILLLLSCFCGLMLGYLNLSPLAVGRALYAPLVGNSTALTTQIIWDLRLPRMLLSATVGMGLSLSGVIMQAMFRNPMASPYIMGISSGASLGVVCAIFFGFGSAFGAGAVGIGAFCGAMVLSLALAAIAGKGRGDTSFLLILGVALSAVCAGITSVIIFSGANSTGMDVSLYWMMGSVAFAKLDHSLFLVGLVIVMALFFAHQSKILNLMMEGQEAAVPLGVNLLPFVRLYLILNAALVGACVMEAGLIGFVGLIVPHFTRMAVGASHRRLLPAAVLAGGILTVWADILGRVLIRGQDIPMGVTLAFIGAPLFIFMLVKRSYHFGGES